MAYNFQLNYNYTTKIKAGTHVCRKSHNRIKNVV